MSAAWPVVPLGEVLHHLKEYIDAPEPREYPKLSVKLYGKGVALDTPADGSALKMQRHQLAHAGQVILSEIWGKKGAIGFVPPEGEGALCTSHFFLFDVNEERLERGWLKGVFQADYLAEQLGAKAFGTTGYAAVRPKDLLACTIPLPPLSEQRRIVAKIERLAGLVEETQGLLQQATAGADRLVTSLHMHLAAGRKKTLGELLRLDEDSVPVAPTSSYPQIGIRSFGGGLFPKNAIDGTATTYRVFNRLYPGALVLSQVKGWEGAVAVCPAELAGWYASPEYRTFRCIPTESRPGYLALIVRTNWFWSRLANATQGLGARRERTRPEQFLSIEIPMPNAAQQQYGEAIFSKLASLSVPRSAAAAEVTAMMPAILDRAFKGEL